MHQSGVGHTAIQGVDRDTVTVRKRFDVAAVLRRTLASCGRRRVTRGVLVVVAVAWLVAAFTATYAGAIVAATLTAIGVGVYHLPEGVYTPPPPAVERGAIVGDGMTDRELMRRYAIVTERERYKNEEIERHRKRERRRRRRTESG